MHLFSPLLLAFVFLLGTAFLTAVNGAFRRLRLQDLKYEASGKYFFYRPFHLYFFPEFEYEGLLAATISAQNITRFFYAFMVFIFLSQNGNFSFSLLGGLKVAGFLLASFLIGDYIPRILAAKFPEKVIKLLAPLSSLFMFASFPITYICLKLTKSQIQSISFEEPLSQTKREIIEIIQRSRLSPKLNTHEKKLIEYVLKFKDRIAREVMMPRVDVFSLSAETPIKKAAKLIAEEGYSRIPVYRNTVDNIIGVLMYKDILNEYMKYETSGNNAAILNASIETIQKNVLYTPETQKISNLLLEFRKKQVHLAIVVDEYGGTEGIVTIEDILEEIVGEIEDEYDEEEAMFFPQRDGSWIVDARMGILDLEQQFGIVIPQEGDYDTLGGYIFHCTGTIPSKGFLIHQEDFEMEILQSNERRVGKVRIKPIAKSKENAEAISESEEP